MNNYFLALAFALVAAACTDDRFHNPGPPPLEGGKGGDFNVAVFTLHDGQGKASRVFLKYAADKAPADTTQYDERMNTMVEPAYGPHVHFDNLKKGTYYIHARSADAKQGDMVFRLTDTTIKILDFNLELK